MKYTLIRIGVFVIVTNNHITYHGFNNHSYIYHDLSITKVEVMDIGLDQCGITAERRITMVDKNRDLFITSVRLFGAERKIIKLGL